MSYETPPRYEPTPQEIREGCQEIQATWSDAERARRAGLTEADLQWTPTTLPAPPEDR